MAKNQSNPEDQQYDATSVINVSLQAKLGKKILGNDRENFIRHLLEFNEILGEMKKRGMTSNLTVKGKDLVQSLVYLTLNKIFYQEILDIRKKLKIPEHGFSSQKEFEYWSLEYGMTKYSENSRTLARSEVDAKDSIRRFGLDASFGEIESLVNKYKTCYKKDAQSLSLLLSRFAAYRVQFEELARLIIMLVAVPEANKKLWAGLDIKTKRLKDSVNNFFTDEWEYEILPFTNLTKIENTLREFFQREIKKPSEEYVAAFLEKSEIIRRRRLAGKEKLEVEEKSDFVLLCFTTNLFTKASGIIKLYRKKEGAIKRIMKKLERKAGLVQKRHLSEKFRRNFMLWDLKQKGLTYDEISAYMHGIGYDLGNSYVNGIKGELGEFNANIQSALHRKIIF